MWSFRIVAPYQFERTAIAEKTPDCLADGQVLLRFLAAGVCGSDMPAFRGVRGVLPGDDGRSGAEKDGYPIHEVVGEVIASRHHRHQPGDRVVGWASGFDGLMERVVTDGNQVASYDPTLSPAQAVGLQPLACGQSGGRPPGHRRRPGRPRRDRHGIWHRQLCAGHQRPLGQPPRPRRSPGRCDRNRRPSGGHAESRDRSRRARRHGVLLRRARRRQLPDQHAHHAASQPDIEIGCGT
jgi:Alcohol dehydrogenase GroES-like domain